MHEARVDLICSRCGETTTEAIYRVRRGQELVCQACGTLISLDSDESRRETDRAEREWQEHWGTTDWRFPES